MICPFCNSNCTKEKANNKTIYSCYIDDSHGYLYDKRHPLMSDYSYHETLQVKDEFIIFNDSNCYYTASIGSNFFEGKYPSKTIPTHFKTAEELRNYLILL